MEEISFLLELLAVVVVFISFAIWFVLDSYSISRYDGKIKRGVKIWAKELSGDSRQYLLSLKADVIEYGKIVLSEYKSGFIRVRDGEVVIFSMPQRFHSSWPFIGYVDLTLPSLELEYRASLPGIIFLMPFTILGLLIFIINFIFQTKAIDSFLERKTQENISQKVKTI